MDLRGLIQYIPKVDKTLKVSGACADAKEVGDRFDKMSLEKFGAEDVVDNLSSDDATKPLSAKQGKVLNGKTEWGTLATGQASEYPIHIPECEEVFFEIVNSSNDACTLKLPYCAFVGKNRKYFVGGHVTASAYFGANISIANDVAQFKDPYLNGSYDSTARLNVYCKGVK